MPIGGVAAAVTAIGGIASSYLGGKAAKKAAKAEAAAAAAAQATTLKMYEQSREDLKPYNETGKGGMYAYADLFGIPTPENPTGATPFAEKGWNAFQATPYYKSNLAGGIDALDHSAAARGNLLSSGQLKRVQEFGADYASRQFGGYLDRLYALAGMGSNAAARTGSNAMSAGGQVADLQVGAGTAKASGIMGANNAVTQGIGDLTNNLAYFASKSNNGYAPETLY